MAGTKRVAILLVAVLLAGCGGGSVSAPLPEPTLPPLSVTAPSQVTLFTSTTPLGASGGQAVVPLFDLADVKTNLGDSGIMFWGTKDAATGAIGKVTEAAVFGLTTPPGGVHAFFNNANLPVLVRDDASGYSIAITYLDATSLSVTLCDPSLNPQGQASATVIGGVAQGGDATDGGSCAVALAATSGSARISGAETSERTTLATTNIGNLSSLAPLFASSAYVAGLAFGVAAILKFKQHKDNPTQIPIGTPIALLFIGGALLFLPTILATTGATLFDGSNVAAVEGLLPLYQIPP